ncbi:MAG: hypothetical protein AAF004_13605 [Pseudomonadota bacterium]
MTHRQSTTEPAASTPRAKVSDSYSVTLGDPVEDRADILRLWQLLPSDQPPGVEKLEWLYIGSPAAAGTIYFLNYIPDGRRVGVVCLGRRDFLHAGQRVEGVVFGDFSIEPAHRSLGPALLFQKQFLKLASERFPVVYGFPNTLSGSVRVFGGHKLNATIVQLTLPLSANSVVNRFGGPRFLRRVINRVSNVLLRTLARARLRSVASRYRIVRADDDFIDTLWARADALGHPVGVRDAKTVRWRLRQLPGQQFDVVGFRRDDAGAAGYLAYRWEDQRTLRIVDHLVSADEYLPGMLARLVLEHGTAARAITVKLHANATSKIAAVKQLGFAERKRADHFVSVADDQPFSANDMRLTMFDNDA